MSLPAIYLPEAQDDVDAAYTRYEQRLAGLGDRFLEALRDLVDRIGDNPALYGVLHQDVRAAPMRRFPYVVYYRAEADKVVIIAVQDGRRSAQAWQGRA
jgi:plasmid stabilization system protein ParE